MFSQTYSHQIWQRQTSWDSKHSNWHTQTRSYVHWFNWTCCFCFWYDRKMKKQVGNQIRTKHFLYCMWVAKRVKAFESNDHGGGHVNIPRHNYRLRSCNLQRVKILRRSWHILVTHDWIIGFKRIFLFICRYPVSPLSGHSTWWMTRIIKDMAKLYQLPCSHLV